MQILLWMHITLCFVTFYREIYEGSTGNFAVFMLFIQVVMMIVLFWQVMEICIIALDFKNVVNYLMLPGYSALGVVPECLASEQTVHTWLGHSIEWF